MEIANLSNSERKRRSSKKDCDNVSPPKEAPKEIDSIRVANINISAKRGK
jgi:hypothetical protein